MANWSTLVTLNVCVLIWLDLTSIGALRVYDEDRLSRLRDEVKSMFYHAYDAYMMNAYPYDELRPLSCDGADSWGSYSLTLIDTLDTLVILGNYSEFRRVAQLIIENSQFDLNINVSVFETNIRIIGGLLSAHLLSHKAGMDVGRGWPCNGPLLHLAEKVARKLLPAFDTKTGMPYGTVNLRYGVPAKETPITCTAGVGTFLVEFGALSRLTGDPLYEKVALRALHSLFSKRSKLDLFGNHIDTDTGKWTAIDAGIGAGVDSFFEYLVKGGILFQKPELMHMFRESYEAIEKHLKKSGWYIWATMGHGHISATTFQSLEAYWPGLLSLVGEFESGLSAIRNYHRIWKQYGALPELYNILHGKATHLREGYPLRPELAESAMYLYRATGDPYMLEIGEDIFYSIKSTMKTDCGFASVRDVTTLTLEDRMESFFLAETVKYLYLLFDPNNFIHNDGEDYTVIQNPMGECTVYAGGYVFNTEAHPIDPSALHCCTGVTENELLDEVAIIDELRTSPQFHGQRAQKTKDRKMSPATLSQVIDSPVTGEEEKPIKFKGIPIGIKTISSIPSGDNSPQLISTKAELSIKPATGSLSSFLDDLDLQLAFTDPSIGASSTSCRNDIQSFLHLIQILFPTNPQCQVPDTVIKIDKNTIISVDGKRSTLEKLLGRFWEEQQKEDFDFTPTMSLTGLEGREMKVLDNDDIDYSIINQTKLREEVKAIEKLIENFETVNTTPTGPTVEKKGKHKRSHFASKGFSKQEAMKQSEGRGKSVESVTERIEDQSSLYNETPDLDLIFGATQSSRSLSFYFSLRWLQKFPELITQLIPSERFDIQNFYSRLANQFSDDGFVKDFNLNLSWTKDYEVLKCDTPQLTDRLNFHRTSPAG